MRVRRIELSKDYPMLRVWWELRGMPAPQEVLLPSIGVIAEEAGDAVACAFLYEDRSGRIAMIEWEATNPKCASAMKAIRGLNMVFDFFESYCRDQGVKALLSWVAFGRGDGRILERRKWVKCPGDRHELMAFQTSVN